MNNFYTELKASSVRQCHHRDSLCLRMMFSGCKAYFSHTLGL